MSYLAILGIFGGGGRSRTDLNYLMRVVRLPNLLPAKQPGVVRSLEDGVNVFSFNPSSRAGRWTVGLRRNLIRPYATIISQNRPASSATTLQLTRVEAASINPESRHTVIVVPLLRLHPK